MGECWDRKSLGQMTWSVFNHRIELEVFVSELIAKFNKCNIIAKYIPTLFTAIHVGMTGPDTCAWCHGLMMSCTDWVRASPGFPWSQRHSWSRNATLRTTSSVTPSWLRCDVTTLIINRQEWRWLHPKSNNFGTLFTMMTGLATHNITRCRYHAF
jgi:hypothetical protein